MAMKSANVVVRTIITMDIAGFHFVMGGNKVNIIRNVLIFWNHKYDNVSDAVRLSVQVRELCE